MSLNFEHGKKYSIQHKVINLSATLGVKPLIHQSELRTYTKVAPFQNKIEWNGLIKIDN